MSGKNIDPSLNKNKALVKWEQERYLKNPPPPYASLDQSKSRFFRKGIPHTPPTFIDTVNIEEAETRIHATLSNKTFKVSNFLIQAKRAALEMEKLLKKAREEGKIVEP